VPLDQFDRGRNGVEPAEIHIGFVDDNRRIGQGRGKTGDFGQRQQAAGRGVGVREDRRAKVCSAAGEVVVDADLELVRQGYGFEVDPVQPAVNRIETVGDVRKEQRLVVLEQSLEGVGQDLVRTVADEDPFRRNAEMAGNGCFELASGRVRIELQAVGVLVQLGKDRIPHFGARRVGVFVGVELDQIGEFGLLAGNIWGQVVDDGAPETAHGRSVPRR